jgi:hypothetical protein
MGELIIIIMTVVGFLALDKKFIIDKRWTKPTDETNEEYKEVLRKQ